MSESNNEQPKSKLTPEQLAEVKRLWDSTPPAEASDMDPELRAQLEAAWSESAGEVVTDDIKPTDKDPSPIQAAIDEAVAHIDNPDPSVDVRIEAGKLRSWQRHAIWRAARHAYLDYPNGGDDYERAVIENAKLDPIISAILIEVILYFARKWLERWLNNNLSASDLPIFPDATAFSVES